VHFSRLRLAGFKSFVDPTDLRIEPGLTGVVGPNGCGKSNLLEALRWVMGASSAKAMRGDGMDDVIFAGSGARPSRNHAEVTLTIDNTDRDAPGAFNAHPVLEVVRRIDRGEGSTYRVNGREVRARDVQLLFADASTGANSPALVRQGQISELIAAKPQNRRRILEEAAGVAGLHTRRHEAELRVRAAEANLARLDDLSRELEANLARLRREARQAEKYRKLSAEIRTLQSAILHARWAEARSAFERLEAEGAASMQLAAAAAGEAAAARTAAIDAEAALGPLRAEETTAAAVLHHLAIEKDRLDRALETATAEAARLTAELARIDADAAREAQIVEDAGRALGRIAAETADLETEIAAAPTRLPELREASALAEAARARAEAAVEALAARAAAGEAQARAIETRLEEARARLARTERALAQARGEREALGPADDEADDGPARALAEALVALEAARTALDEGEAARAAAAGTEAQARQEARAAEDGLAQALAEARGLAQLTAAATGRRFAPALDQISPQRGLEAALAAALGDDLSAALDPAAPAYWGGGEATAPTWPKGASPLGPLVAAPGQLAARLAFTALVKREDGPSLQAKLAPGMRLVSREGDLWRWDGFVAAAEAPKPAQARLEQKARLADVEAEIERLRPLTEAAKAAHAAAAAALRDAEAAVAQARGAPRIAETAVARAREAVEARGRERARRDARAQSLDETIARFDEERGQAQDALAAVRAEADAALASPDLGPELAKARTLAQAAREAASGARGALDIEARDCEGRANRLDRLRADHADWSGRTEAAARRQTGLARDRVKALAALEEARAAPSAARERAEKLADELAVAQARAAASGDALAAAETARAEADRRARAADAAAADAREARATLAARHEAAVERLAEYAAALTEATGLDPQALGRKLAAEAVATPGESGGIETHLAHLERERDAIGPVNLRAEDEAAELAARVAALRAERADLAGALSRLRQAIGELNAEGRERLTAAFAVINGHFTALFTTLFEGGQAELRLVESDDPLEAGLEIFACPPGKRMAVMSLMSGGEQALTAVALIFAVFLANPAPICVLDEVDAPLDDANVERLCNLLEAMRQRAPTRFVTITHNALTMSRMDRLFGVTMRERGVSQLVSVDLRQAEALAAE
jgi:chromosome segregation protein